MESISDEEKSKFIDLLERFKSLENSDKVKLNEWDEKFFLTNHFPSAKIKGISQAARREVNLKLIKFFSGMSRVYEGIMEDMQHSILSMRSPESMKKLLFEEFVDEYISSDTSQTATVYQCDTIKVKAGYTAMQEEITSEKEDIQYLAESVEEKSESKEKVKESYDERTLNDSWNALKEMIDVSSNNPPGKNLVYAETAMGLICLHCFKLLSKTPQSVMRSMTNNMNRHFLHLYKPKKWTTVICPPHIDSLHNLKDYFRAPGSTILNTLSLIIGKVIVEMAKPSSVQSVRGVLYGACVIHVSMHGLTAPKLLEQTAAALGLSVAKFSNLIHTTRVSDSLINATQLLEKEARAPGIVNIMGQEYNLKSQFSWRFYRHYNPVRNDYFYSITCNPKERLTESDIRLILRCAAYLANTQHGMTIENMKLLESPTNRKIYREELSIAKKYFESRELYGVNCDFPIKTDEDAAVAHLN